MRILMKVEMPTEKANELARKGALGSTIKSILDEQKPEAAYFAEFNGKRTGIIVVNVEEPSRIPAIAEPWFLALDAHIEFHPAMTAADLAKASADIDRAGKKYG